MKVETLAPALAKKNTFHRNVGWKAEDFFDDKNVVELCRAIESNDLRRMDQLITAGTDVNTIGRDSITPLLWSYPDDKITRFKKLLEAGASPNVPITSDLGVPQAFQAGSAVVHLCADTAFSGYFPAVMEHGGDPNLRNGDGNQVIHLIIRYGASDPLTRIKLAMDHGGDINAHDGLGNTPAMAAVGSFQQFDLAYELVQIGADIDTFKDEYPSKLIHALVGKRDVIKHLPTSKQVAYQKLLGFLVENGEDPAQAIKDIDRWQSWASTRLDQFPELIATEAAKVRREQRILNAAKVRRNDP